MSNTPESTVPGRSTLLNAVNVLLLNIGEEPVDNLLDLKNQEARMAQLTIEEFHKDGQARGWTWNTDIGYTFNVDTEEEIVGPGNVLAFQVDPYQYNNRFMLRGKKVYDRLNKTTKFPSSSGITQIQADVIWMLSWDDSPEVYNRYTTIRSARVFSTRVLGSDSVTQFTAVDEEKAMTELMRVEMLQANANALTGGPFGAPFPTYQPSFGLMRGGGPYVG